MSEKTLKSASLQVLLDEFSSFEGELRFKGAARLSGQFKGLIRAEGSLVIEKTASVVADIFVDELFLHGKLEGLVEAKQAVFMEVPASFKGEVKTPSLSIEPGVSFEGSSSQS